MLLELSDAFLAQLNPPDLSLSLFADLGDISKRIAAAKILQKIHHVRVLAVEEFLL